MLPVMNRNFMQLRSLLRIARGRYYAPAIGGILPRQFESNAAIRSSHQNCCHFLSYRNFLGSSLHALECARGLFVAPPWRSDSLCTTAAKPLKILCSSVCEKPSWRPKNKNSQSFPRFTQCATSRATPYVPPTTVLACLSTTPQRSSQQQLSF